MDDRDIQILRSLKHLNEESAQFAFGIATSAITREAQVRFAHLLVDLAEVIRDKVTGPSPTYIVIEGSVSDDGPATNGEPPGTSRDA
ncbi:MAG TPA: hypothetical protein VHX38_17435 [Pseudonocardiaceae bacterium]|jgi:hypothetical protein|nr:hypothetical protein [Pseudonocardiaceae bacterium]